MGMKDDLDVLFGNPPYDNWSNICYGDGYYAKSLERKYGMSIDEMKRKVYEQNSNSGSKPKKKKKNKSINRPKLKRIQNGQCPRCGSEQIELSDPKFGKNYRVNVNGKCKTCEHKWQVRYSPYHLRVENRGKHLM